MVIAFHNLMVIKGNYSHTFIIKIFSVFFTGAYIIAYLVQESIKKV